MHGYKSLNDLPASLPIFPLGGALLLPGGRLPLNIFEPRYLAMVNDAMAGARLIGMVQPRDDPKGASNHGGLAGAPEIYNVGCAGRVTSYAETEDGRYMITLTGVCRFRSARELAATTPYRQIEARWDDFAGDLDPDGPGGHDGPAREALVAALGRYLKAQGLDADWSSIERAPVETLISSLAMICPFATSEKQALLEAGSVGERGRVLLTLMEMAAAGGGGGGDGGGAGDQKLQ